MSVFAVHYVYAPEHSDGRDEHRAAHRAWLGEMQDAGRVLLAGPYPDGGGALILVRATDAGDAEALMSADPFGRLGLVESATIREWLPVFGPIDA